MDKDFNELLRNMELAYSTGSEIRVKEVINLANKVLVTDGIIDDVICNTLIRRTPLRLVWSGKNDIDGKQHLSLKYKDISVEFYSTNTVTSPPTK